MHQNSPKLTGMEKYTTIRIRSTMDLPHIRNSYRLQSNPTLSYSPHKISISIWLRVPQHDWMRQLLTCFAISRSVVAAACEVSGSGREKFYHIYSKVRLTSCKGVHVLLVSFFNGFSTDFQLAFVWGCVLWINHLMQYILSILQRLADV